MGLKKLPFSAVSALYIIIVCSVLQDVRIIRPLMSVGSLDHFYKAFNLFHDSSLTWLLMLSGSSPCCGMFCQCVQ